MLTIFNTLTGKKEALQPKKGKKLNLFVCGPTVYDFAHIGHARTYIVFDAFVRYLTSQKFSVFYLQNITDIDDKIIKRAAERKENPKALARRFEKEYLKDMKALGIQSVTKYARATDYIPEIISQVERLLKKGYAYLVEGDGLYYDISKFKEYGKLSKRTTTQAEDSVSRIDESVQKRNKGDFALWKFSKKEEPKWKSPWGWGRPGWHIEDTAITEKYFGVQYDMHGGARDLIFPHHEAEIAQMEAISGKSPLAKYWMHSGFLTVEGEKMSKSLGNFLTIQDFLRVHSPRILRFLVLKTHWRSPIDYSEKLLVQTAKELERIDEFVDKLAIPSASLKASSRFQISSFKTQLQDALEDDFNTPKAIAVLFDLITQGNKILEQGMAERDRKTVLDSLKEQDRYLGFLFVAKKKHTVPPKIKKLLEQREEYRLSKEWIKADELRKLLEAQGWHIDDTPQGSRLKKF